MEKVFSIPCPEHLKAYASKAFFDGMASPYKITERSLFGKMIMSALLDKRKPEEDTDQVKREQGDDDERWLTLDVELSVALAKRSPNIFKLVRINSFLNQLFYFSLYEFYLCLEHDGISRYTACEKFYSFYGIKNKLLISRGFEYVNEKKKSAKKKASN
jgi:hypothetical protein